MGILAGAFGGATLAEELAALLARPLRLLSKVSAPAVAVLDGTSRLVLRLLGARPSEEPALDVNAPPEESWARIDASDHFYFPVFEGAAEAQGAKEDPIEHTVARVAVLSAH